METAENMWKDVVANAPYKTGSYVASIQLGDTTEEKGTFKTEVFTDLVVGPAISSGNSYNLGFLLETGTNPHIIEPVNAKALHFQINGQDIFTKLVNHPGTVAQPHFNPALIKAKEMQKEAIRKAIKEAIK